MSTCISIVARFQEQQFTKTPTYPQNDQEYAPILPIFQNDQISSFASLFVLKTIIILKLIVCFPLLPREVPLLFEPRSVDAEIHPPYNHAVLTKMSAVVILPAYLIPSANPLPNIDRHSPG